jgi:hypothetical protein
VLDRHVLGGPTAETVEDRGTIPAPSARADLREVVVDEGRESARDRRPVAPRERDL